MGWEIFTDRVVQLLCERQRPLIFLLWGKSAFTKFRHVEACAFGHHHVLTASHPSPLSAHTGFFGCGHFSKADDILKKIGEKPIDWATQ
jgi:uracil-DNA glycosylase